jgi:hypothetical protein
MMMLTTTWSVGRNKSDEAGKRKEREKRKREKSMKMAGRGA